MTYNKNKPVVTIYITSGTYTIDFVNLISVNEIKGYMAKDSDKYQTKSKPVKMQAIHYFCQAPPTFVDKFSV